MSGRTFGMQSSWDDTLKKLTSGLDVDGAQLRQAVGMADSMNQQLEEFINRFVVTANNDAGDITFDAAGTYTFSGNLVVDGTSDLNGAVTIDGDSTVNGTVLVNGIMGLGVDPSGLTKPFNIYHATFDTIAAFESGDRYCSLSLQDSTSTDVDYVRVGSDGDDFMAYAGNEAHFRVASNGHVSMSSLAGYAQDPLCSLHIFDGTSAFIMLQDSNGVDGGAINSKLQFRGSSVTYGDVGFETTGGNMVCESRIGDFYVGTRASADVFLKTNNTTRMTIDSVGRVGIGDTSPSSQIDVAATGRRAFRFKRLDDVDAGAVTLGVMQIGADSDSSNPGTGDYWILFRRGDDTTIGSVRGTGSASVNFSTTSDATLKTDNGPVAEARIGGIIDDLRIHDFDWIDGEVSNQIGVFAQEAIEVLPDSIVAPPGEDAEGEYLPASLDYSKIVPILVAECQFLRGRVSALESAASGNRPA